MHGFKVLVYEMKESWKKDCDGFDKDFRTCATLVLNVQILSDWILF